MKEWNKITKENVKYLEKGDQVYFTDEGINMVIASNDGAQCRLDVVDGNGNKTGEFYIRKYNEMCKNGNAFKDFLADIEAAEKRGFIVVENNAPASYFEDAAKEYVKKLNSDTEHYILFVKYNGGLIYSIGGDFVDEETGEIL